MSPTRHDGRENTTPAFRARTWTKEKTLGTRFSTSHGGRCFRRRWRKFPTQSNVRLKCSWPHDRAPNIDSYTDALANVGNSKIQYTKPTTISCLVGPRQSLAKISTVFPPGPLEESNNKIKTLQKMAYGFRDMEFLKIEIKALHEIKYALVG